MWACFILHTTKEVSHRQDVSTLLPSAVSVSFYCNFVYSFASSVLRVRSHNGRDVVHLSEDSPRDSSQRIHLINPLPPFPTSGTELVFFWLLVIGLATILISDFTFIPLAMIHDRLQTRYPDPGKERPLVTVIVPAYNEEKNLSNLLDSLLEQSYPNFEIIVVNDGSTDGTPQIVRNYMRKFANIQLIDMPRPNHGKTVALNTGISVANGQFVVVMDADGVSQRNCIMRIVAALQQPGIIAVAGNVKVANRVSFLTKLQALEYVRDNNVPRRAFDLMDISIVIPGPIGGFRKAYVNAVGAYDLDTVAEDFDLTVKLHKAKDGVVRGIRNVTDAIVYTEAPEYLNDLFRQRKRWYGGMTQTMIKHLDKKLVIGSGTYSAVGIPYSVVTLWVVPILELFMTTLGLIMTVLTGFLWYVIAFLVYSFLETLVSYLALRLDQDDIRLIVYSPLFVLGYRQLLDVIRVYAYYEMLRGRLAWTRAERYGEVRERARSAVMIPGS